MGGVALGLTVGASLLLGLSFSSARDTPGVALRLASAGVLGAGWVAWRQRALADRGWAAEVRDVALLVPGVLPAVAFVWEGVSGPRLDCEPASLAAAPLAAFAGYLALPLLGWIWAVTGLRQGARPPPR
jgi:hypothetical protein